MKIVFLHGIGDGIIKAAWFDALRDSLDALGYPRLDLSDVIQPNYAPLLDVEPPPECPLPPLTAPSLGDAEIDRLRWGYWRRQAALERLLADAGTRGAAIGFPESLVECALIVPVLNIKQANKYVKNEGLRGCVLRTVLDQLPKSGEVVIVGHSLGSLVAIDLLDHLPGEITVRRLVTIGSPAGHPALLSKKNPLLRKFPLSRVMSWANLWSVRDPVCYGCGIAHHFPHALDFRVELGMCEHRAEGYLRNPKIGTAVGDAIFGSPGSEVATLETTVDVPLDDQERLILAALAYAHLLADQLKDDPRNQQKFFAALAEVQQSLIDSVVDRCQTEQRAVPAQFREIVCELAAGGRPQQSALFDLGRAIQAMLTLLSGNVIAPYEIKTEGKQRKLALEGLAAFLELPSGVGRDVFDALGEARKVVKDSSSWLVPLLSLAAGSALLALGPLGLMMAAPAELAGGAAIVAALAKFGIGGMVGGLATAGGMMAAGGGAAGAAINALALAPEAAVEHTVAQLLATAIARHKLGLPRDDRIWFLLCELEAQIARQLQGLAPFSDIDAPSVKALERKAGAVRQAIKYLVDHGLAPLLP